MKKLNVNNMNIKKQKTTLSSFNFNQRMFFPQDFTPVESLSSFSHLCEDLLTNK